MQRGQGHADNQLIWFADLPYSPQAEALDLLERWLESMRANPGLSVVEARPVDASDRCYSEDGDVIASGADVWNGPWMDDWHGSAEGACLQRFPMYSNPRLVAGDDFASDIFKCHLQSVDSAIAQGVYAPVDVTARRDDLQRVFATGVCDYSLGDAARPADLP